MFYEQDKKCKYCKSEIDSKAVVCPHCGRKQGMSKAKKAIITVVVVIIVIAAIGKCAGTSNTDTSTTQSTFAPAVTTEQADATFEQAAANDASVEDQAAPAQDNIPTEYKSALKKAKIYSDTMHMSKMGIYDQLTSEYGEKFSAEAAQYAVDNLDADYKENALKKAETYQETMSMSPEAIRDQLVSEYGEKFTQEEADYAIANLK